MTLLHRSSDNQHPQPGSVVLQGRTASGGSGWLHFHHPLHTIHTTQLAEVLPALREVEVAVSSGLHAAGFVTYEAAPAFDEAFTTHPAGALPLLWFGLYEQVVPIFVDAPAVDFTALDWRQSVSEAEYRHAIARIKDYIARGHTYQVNFTMRLQTDFHGDPWVLFQALIRAQRAQYCAYVDLGEHVLCSASPELFFDLAGTHITCRPMKGTASRGLTSEADKAQACWLQHSEKNRAENVMIVDMLRNDLGRIARVGSVQVPRMFAVERYETLLQMTSTVTATTAAAFSEVFTALFPCSSITGAPKVRTMEIIRELETTPRGIYTGCIGYLSPQRQAQFNVAIRTVHVDRIRQRAEYGTGGGIVWDSTAQNEFAECRTKAKVLFTHQPTFRLLETVLWKPWRGYFLLERHLNRLMASARYFGFRVDCEQVMARLQEAAGGFPSMRHRVRLLVDDDGAITIEAAPLPRQPRQTCRVAIASKPVDKNDRFLYHKTTHRVVYEAARAEHPDFDDVLLWNADGEITESTIANVVACINGQLLTPPVTCGLLPGTYRDYLLEKKRVREGIIRREDLQRADAIYLVNSVRGWIPVQVRR